MPKINMCRVLLVKDHIQISSVFTCTHLCVCVRLCIIYTCEYVFSFTRSFQTICQLQLVVLFYIGNIQFLSLPAFDIATIFYFNHVTKYIVIAHCGRNLHFKWLKILNVFS